MTFWITDWLRMFALTLLVELAVALPLWRATEPRVLRRAAAVALVNLATHPVVWFVIPGAALGQASRACISELWAVGIEALAYRVIFPLADWRRTLTISFLANLASFVAGELLHVLDR